MYSKYHGCGNDFILGIYDENIDYSKFTQCICNRHTGIGADGVIVGKKNRQTNNYEMVFYNADGTRGLMCGNGIRCLAAYLKDNNLVTSDTFLIETLSGIRSVHYRDGLYEINMGKPDYSSEKVEIDTSNKDFFNVNYEYENVTYNLNAIFMTTHHLVIPVDDLNIAESTGKYFCTNKIFTKGINVNFAKVIDRNTITMRTYERGVGWTKACGSGACSVVAVMRMKGLVNDSVNVKLEYGTLNITFKDEEIIMKGPATLIASNINYCLAQN